MKTAQFRWTLAGIAAWALCLTLAAAYASAQTNAADDEEEKKVRIYQEGLGASARWRGSDHPRTTARISAPGKQPVKPAITGTDSDNESRMPRVPGGYLGVAVGVSPASFRKPRISRSPRARRNRVESDSPA